MASLGIRIKWKDNNDFEDGFRIYRKEEPFDKDNLPEAHLAELPPNTEVFVDETAAAETTFHYLVSTFVGGNEIFAASSIKASNYAGPLALGEFYQGGYYAGNMTVPSGDNEGTYAILVAPKSAEANLAWRSSGADTPNAVSKTDGAYNTQVILDASGVFPAATHCSEYRGGGNDDWFLPAEDTLALIYANESSLGILELASSNYWSSTQNSAANARTVNMSNGNRGNGSKPNSYVVRPVRRIRIS